MDTQYKYGSTLDLIPNDTLANSARSSLQDDDSNDDSKCDNDLYDESDVSIDATTNNGVKPHMLSSQQHEDTLPQPNGFAIQTKRSDQEDFDSLEEEIFQDYMRESTTSPDTCCNNGSYSISPDVIVSPRDVEACMGDGTTPENEPDGIRKFLQSARHREETAHRVNGSNQSIPRPVSPPFAVLTMNLSFAGCGFLGIYHLGVAHALAHHGGRLMLNIQKFGGASAGSLVAAALAVYGPDKHLIEECLQFYYGLAESVHKKKMGVLTPRMSLLDPLQSFLSNMLPDDAHIIAHNRLYISITKARSRKNILVSEFQSKEHLIQYLMASSYVPFITGSKPVTIDGKKYFDGGATDNLPDIPAGRTVRVTPFSGRQEICPMDNSRKSRYVRIQGQDWQANVNNVRRGIHALFPPKRKHLERYFERGKIDTIKFLKRENFYSDES